MDSKIRIYNTLERRVMDFVPISDDRINMFVCGPTVYDDSHLGHAKTFVNFDMIVRWLRYRGYSVKYIQNITDIDDKIIKRANERSITPKELAEYYEKRFLEDMERLGVRKNVDMYPRSHDFIEQIRDQIQMLIDKGFGYYLDGDIYYEVDKFKDYTKLSGMSLEDLSKHRIEPKDGKRKPYDFALWKTSKEGEPSWSINLNIGGNEVVLNGRPGWHIEDTAITFSLFGPKYDIHGGANELIFPHHTNEIAQAEAAFGEVPFVNYWMHSGIFVIKGAKMSKSLHNFVTIREFLEKHSAETFRFIAASTHYRNEIEYSEELITESMNRLNNIYATLSLLNHCKETDTMTPKAEIFMKHFEEFEKSFEDFMDNDFETQSALNGLVVITNELRSFIESEKCIQKRLKDYIFSSVQKLAGIIGILESKHYMDPLPAAAEKLISEREAFRKSGNFKESDVLRERIRSEFGIVVEDSKENSTWYWLAPKS